MVATTKPPLVHVFELIQGLLKLVGREVPTDERREMLRLQCDLEILIWIEGSIHKAKVVDVHMSGLCLEAVEPLKVGQKISLARDDFGRPWEGEVLWCRPRSKVKGYLAGVGFPTDPEMLRNSWVQPALLAIGFQTELLGEKRKRLRVPAEAMTGKLKDLEGVEIVTARLRNLSLGGVQLLSSVPLEVLSSVHFETAPRKGMPTLSGRSKVIYCRAQPDESWLCGLRFQEKEDADTRKVMASLVISR